jgi:uncharacterized protein (DUF433 family)
MEKKFPRITSDPQIMAGKAIIRGHRFRVVDILQYLAAGDTRKTLLKEFDFLEDEDITEALNYAAEVMLRPKPELDALQRKTAKKYERLLSSTAPARRKIISG